MLYYFGASRNYNPEPHLDKITVPLTAVNSADDVINPPELKIIDVDIQRVRQGKFVLLLITDATRGHGTHSLPAIWEIIYRSSWSDRAINDSSALLEQFFSPLVILARFNFSWPVGIDAISTT